jgi:hypothetical protein
MSQMLNMRAGQAPPAPPEVGSLVDHHQLQHHHRQVLVVNDENTNNISGISDEYGYHQRHDNGYEDSRHERADDHDDLDDSTSTPNHRQYFIRSSFNASIRTRRSRRSSRRNPRQTPWRGARHVRFQPVPQAIDISITSSNGFDTHESPAAHDTAFSEGLSHGDGGLPAGHQDAIKTIRLKTVQQQLTRFCRKSRIQFTGVKPKFSAKPLQHLPGHIKSSFGKIKLKTLNNLASQLQSTLTSHHQHQRHQFEPNGPDDTTTRTATGGDKRAGNKSKAPIQRTFHLRHSAASAKHQITLNISNRDAISSADLEALHSRVSFSTVQSALDDTRDDDAENEHDDDDNEDDDDEHDDGWGSDFDESQSTAGPEDNSLNSTGATGCAAGGYLLEIGKSSCDTRAIFDVIQDQGTSGQFKRLNDVSCIDYDDPVPSEAGPCDEHDSRQQQVLAPAPTKPAAAVHKDEKLELIRASISTAAKAAAADKSGAPPERPANSNDSSDNHSNKDHETQPTADGDQQRQTSSAVEETPQVADSPVSSPSQHDEDAAEEEAELRSLEARQNFKQLRDKLKVILEQRLASYEHNLKPKLSSSSGSGNTSSSSCGSDKDSPAGGLQQSGANAPCPANRGAGSASSEAPRQHQQQRQLPPLPPLPPPLVRKPSEPIAVAVGLSAKQQDELARAHHRHQTGMAASRRRHPLNQDHFDCQSNCSEASSLSSGGLDSNHSGSQDSGHSTQHSADDAGRSSTASRTAHLLHHHHHSHHQPGGASSSSGCSSVSPVSTSPTTVVVVNCAPGGAKAAAESAAATAVTVSAKPLSSTAATTRYPLDAATRMRLLEQQRQMSLKLKQKPRRRTARRALNLECSSSADEDETDRAAGVKPPLQRPAYNEARQAYAPHAAGLTGPTSSKSALSLRELIKEVIDNCEKPGKLSKLTRSVLTRSDSWSSQEEAAAATDQQHSDRSEQASIAAPAATAIAACEQQDRA